MKALALALTLLAAPAAAHPHLFIDTAITVHFDAEGRATGITVGWHYDEFFTLVYLQDQGLDPDLDGVLTADEQARLTGFDMRWEPGYPGDTYALLDEAALTLSGPQDPTAVLEADRIRTTHRRDFATPVAIPPGATLILQAYDPSYYTAYSIALEVGLDGRGDCLAEVWEPDLSQADEVLKSALAELSATETLEDGGFTPVGPQFSEEVRVTCGG